MDFKACIFGLFFTGLYCLMIYRWRKYLRHKARKTFKYAFDGASGERKGPLAPILMHIDNDIPTLYELNGNINAAKKEMYFIVKGISECFKSVEPFKLLLAGSAAERFNIPLSDKRAIPQDQDEKVMENTDALYTDHDFMIYDTLVQASFYDGERFLIDTQDLPVGFARIHCNKTNLVVSAKETKEQIYNCVKRMRYDRLPGFRKVETNCLLAALSLNTELLSVEKAGPAIKIKQSGLKSTFLVDLTFSIQCKEWPEMSDWLTRQRKWPNDEDVQRIVQRGFHFVPKSHSEDASGMTWRFSFSQPEVQLLNLIEPVSRRIFIALKFIVKDFLIPDCKRLRTYYFKTIFMHVLEITEPSFWRENDIEKCFHWLLDHVINAVKTKNCPHFWLKGINLFEELTDKDVADLMKLLRKIKNDPSNYIDDSTVKKQQYETIENGDSGDESYANESTSLV